MLRTRWLHRFIPQPSTLATVDDLLRIAAPANQTTHSGSSNTQSAWKTLPNTPVYQPAAAVVVGSLFAVGGQEISAGEDNMKEV